MAIIMKRQSRRMRGYISSLHGELPFKGFWIPSCVFKRGDVIVDPLAAAATMPTWQLRTAGTDHTSSATYVQGSELSNQSVMWQYLNTNGLFKGPFQVYNSAWKPGQVGLLGQQLSLGASQSTIPLDNTALASPIRPGQVVQVVGSGFVQNHIVSATAVTGASLISIWPQAFNFNYPTGAQVMVPSMYITGNSGSGNPVYAVGDIVINPLTLELTRALYSDSNNGGVWTPARWADIGVKPFAIPFSSDVIIDVPGLVNNDSAGMGLWPRHSRFRYPRVKPLAVFATSTDFNFITTAVGASIVADADPVMGPGNTQLPYNGRYIKNVATSDISNQIVRVRCKVPGSGNSRTSITNTYLEVSSAGPSAFAAGNYHRFDIVLTNDNKLAENTWDWTGVRPPDWIAVGAGASLTQINSIRFNLVNAVASQQFSLDRVELQPNNGASGSLGDGRAKAVLWFDDSSTTLWNLGLQVMASYGFSPQIAAGGGVGRAGELSPEQVRYLTAYQGARFAVHYYNGNDGQDPFMQQSPGIDTWILRAKHGLMTQGAEGVDDFAYHDNTHMQPGNYRALKAYFRSARKYDLAETIVDTLPPVNNYAVRAKGTATADIEGQVANLAGTISPAAAVGSIGFYQSTPPGVSLVASQPLLVSDNNNKNDIFTVLSAASPLSIFVNVATQTPSASYQSGTLTSLIPGMGLLGATVAASTAISTINLQGPAIYPIFPGQALVLQQGANLDTVTTTATVVTGASQIQIATYMPYRTYAPASCIIIEPGSYLRGMIDKAIANKMLAQFVWDPSITSGATGSPGSLALLQNVCSYLDSQRPNIDTVPFGDACAPWITHR